MQYSYHRGALRSCRHTDVSLVVIVRCDAKEAQLFLGFNYKTITHPLTSAYQIGTSQHIQIQHIIGTMLQSKDMKLSKFLQNSTVT